MTNKYNSVLYTGVTSDLKQRVYEHKQGIGSKFTSKYNANKLVYYEISEDVYIAIDREKQIKAGSRQKKIDLINIMNPEWNDLYLVMVRLLDYVIARNPDRVIARPTVYVGRPTVYVGSNPPHLHGSLPGM
jgi:putative endonuclease